MVTAHDFHGKGFGLVSQIIGKHYRFILVDALGVFTQSSSLRHWF